MAGSRRVGVVGAGWAGATVARCLHEAGVAVEVMERSRVVGGHSRVELLDGVVYEPNGAHIFHTSDAEIASFVRSFGLTRPYAHVVAAEVLLHETDEDTVLLSWPPQVAELEALPLWPMIARELASLPSRPSGEDFESYVISMMGPTLYGLFIRDYTTKQWGRHPSELSSNFAPKRVELRRDGYRRLFRDQWEFFAAGGINEVVARILAPVAVTMETTVSVGDLDDMAREFDALVITAPLDVFLDRSGALEWRGIEMKSHHIPVSTPDETVTSGYVVNHPSLRVPYTRTVETKHASGQRINATVVSEEYPGSPERHYPVATPGRRFERQNDRLKEEIRERSPIPVFFCGRLANYTYINQDGAIRDGFTIATEVLEMME